MVPMNGDALSFLLGFLTIAVPGAVLLIVMWCKRGPLQKWQVIGGGWRAI